MRDFLLSLPRNKKRALVIVVDAISLIAAVWLAFILRTDQFFWPSNGYPLTAISASQLYTVFLLAPLITILILYRTKLYRSITRYITSETYLKMSKACIFASVVWTFFIYHVTFLSFSCVCVFYVFQFL